jgi:lipoyl(octanoyl) transferase
MQFLSSSEPVDYQFAVSFMEDRVAGIHNRAEDELIWFLEHPSIYTAGTSAKEIDLRNPQFPVIQTGRGGQYTYHGKGQLIAYVMCDLKQHQNQLDLRAYIQSLEYWIIKSLDDIGITGKISDNGVGIWVDTLLGLSKIAAIGVRVRHGITYHGISLNIDPDLSHYQGIVPCGISDLGVTSLKELGVSVTRQEMETILTQNAF